MSDEIPSRKKDHVELCVYENVKFRNKTTGFERYDIPYCALPEVNFSDISLSTTFLQKKISLPLMISCMTGGYEDAERINGIFAAVCEDLHIPLGVGSQRQALVSNQFHSSFSIVRKIAPSIPILANIGASEILKKEQRLRLNEIIDLVAADALTIHINPLQELLQPEGTPSFKGILDAIGSLACTLPIPIVVKEVGAGISGKVALQLLERGVTYIDVAGAGGTSWAGVELLRNPSRESLEIFWDIGIPTSTCLEMITPLKTQYPHTLIASGGITNGLEIFKSLCLGADIASIARPFITSVFEGGETGLRKKFQSLELQFRSAMFLSGAESISDIRGISLVNNSPHL